MQSLKNSKEIITTLIFIVHVSVEPYDALRVDN